MPFKTTHREMKSYYNALQRCTTRMVCPHCSSSLLPKHFENHCRVNHNFETKTSCVWCQRFTWPINEKRKYGKHLLNCFKNFNSAPHRLLDMTHPFPERNFFDHVMTHPNPMFNDNVEDLINTPASPLPAETLPPLPITFEDENLNLAASCVLLFLETRGTHDFFHAMVKLVAFESFLEAMNEDSGTSHTLAFSCWCDGGAYPEPEYRQHLHAIVVSPKGHFSERVWPRIKLPEDKPPPKRNFPCKKLKAITLPLHLANTIGYLSRRESRCNFSFKKSGAKRDNHFYFYRTLPVDFKLHLALLWNNGVSQLLKQTQFQNVSVGELAKGVLTHDGRRWTQKIKDFYKLERGLVVRVSRDYVPTREITPHFLHLVKGEKLYFEKLPEKLDPDTWLQKQIEGGNCFYDAIEENTWIPRPRDQRILKYHKPMVDRCRELESRLEESNHRCGQLESRVGELEEFNRNLTRENNTLRSKIEEMHLKIQQLTDHVIQSQRKEIARLEQENAALKSENERLNSLI